jgi:hypothetical protein
MRLDFVEWRGTSLSFSSLGFSLLKEGTAYASSGRVAVTPNIDSFLPLAQWPPDAGTGGSKEGRRKPILPGGELGHEIYVTASVLGACTYVGLDALGTGRLSAMMAGFLVTFVVRSLAIKFGWSLPVFRDSSRRERGKSAPKKSAREERR